MKRCTKCRKYLPLDQFYVRAGSNRPQSCCKACHLAHMRAKRLQTA